MRASMAVGRLEWRRQRRQAGGLRLQLALALLPCQFKVTSLEHHGHVVGGSNPGILGHCDGRAQAGIESRLEQSGLESVVA